MKSDKRLVTGAILRNSFERRNVVVGAVQGGIGLLLAGRLGYLAVAQNEKYELQAESNRVNLSLTPPRRGWILDRSGRPLASNKADFRVDVIPDRMTEPSVTLANLGQLLQLSDIQLRDIEDRIKMSGGFAPVEVASGLKWEQFAAISVRLPDMPGVITQRGFSRYYPTGPSVGHMLGYVGTASREEWEAEDKAPLLITPGYKVGKDGIEKQFENQLRGQPGGRRVEVTASGRIVRELEAREDVPGKPIQLTLDGPLQDFAARRIGLESGSVVVMDCLTGDLLCAASMPSFDPNSFSNGIGRIEWKMLSEDDHVPLRNKVLNALYPPGSTLKPMAAMALLEAGVSPDETVVCGGGYRLGNRVFRCLGRHGPMTMHRAIAKSCNTYFYTMAHRHGYEIIAKMARAFGLGEKYDLPVVSQSYGTIPDAAWKRRRFSQNWTSSDSLNAVIGQGYVIANPMQLAVMASCIASGKRVRPRLIAGQGPMTTDFDYDPEHFEIVRQAMSEVVNGNGTAGRSKLPFPDIMMGGKTGTAQVRRISSAGRGGAGVARRYRDHGLFVFFAPVDKPRYAGAVVIEHGIGGSRSAAPVARDVMTYLFDPQKGLDALHKLENDWGGTAQQRLEAKYRSFAAQYGAPVPSTPSGEATQASGISGQGTNQPAAEHSPSSGTAPQNQDAPAGAPQQRTTPDPAAAGVPQQDRAPAGVTAPRNRTR